MSAGAVTATAGVAGEALHADNRRVLHRFLHRRDGTLRYWRLVALLGMFIALAIFGGALIWIVPTVTSDGWLRATLVMVAIAGLKLPLILLLWSFIRRNAEWPGRRVAWSDDEVAEILRHLTRRAGEALDQPDAAARLAYLSREAWNVADSVGGGMKVDALTVALRIDEELIVRRERGVPG